MSEDRDPRVVEMLVDDFFSRTDAHFSAEREEMEKTLRRMKNIGLINESEMKVYLDENCNPR